MHLNGNEDDCLKQTINGHLGQTIGPKSYLIFFKR